MLYSSEKNSHFAKYILLPNILLRIPTVHYGCYLQDSLGYELYTVNKMVVFCNFSFSNHHEKWPSSKTTIINSNPSYLNCTLWVAKECWVANLVMRNANFSWNCTTSNRINKKCDDLWSIEEEGDFVATF